MKINYKKNEKINFKKTYLKTKWQKNLFKKVNKKILIN